MSSKDVALESYRLFREAGCDHLHACAWLGNEDGETSFRIGVWGDKTPEHPEGTAFDPAQHHKARRDAIAKPPPQGAGIDVLTASHADQIRAIIWEMTKGGYRHVMPSFTAETTMREAVSVLVRKFEQSGNQLRDINRRTALAEYWAKEIAE